MTRQCVIRMKPALIEIICNFGFSKMSTLTAAFHRFRRHLPMLAMAVAATLPLLTMIAFAKQQPGDIARPAEIMVARQCAYQALKRLDTPVMPVAQLTKAIIQGCRAEILAALDEMEAHPEVSNTDVNRFRRNDLDNPDLDELIGQLIAVFREE